MPSRSLSSTRKITATSATPKLRKTAATGTSAKRSTTPPPSHEAIAMRAHDLYVQSGFQGGREVEFWLEAERELKGQTQVR